MRAKTKKLTVRVPTDQYALIKAAAEGLGVTINAYVISSALTDADDRSSTAGIAELLAEHADAMEAAMVAVSERLMADQTAANERVKNWLQKIIEWQQAHATGVNRHA